MGDKVLESHLTSDTKDTQLILLGLISSLQWDRNWTAANVLDFCDWVQCLRPPAPPDWTNLLRKSLYQ